MEKKENEEGKYSLNKFILFYYDFDFLADRVGLPERSAIHVDTQCPWRCLHRW